MTSPHFNDFCFLFLIFWRSTGSQTVPKIKKDTFAVRTQLTVSVLLEYYRRYEPGSYFGPTPVRTLGRLGPIPFRSGRFGPGPTKDRKGLMPPKRTEKNIRAPKRTFICHFMLLKCMLKIYMIEIFIH